MSHIFDWDPKDYEFYKKADPLKLYIEHMGYYLHVSKGCSIEEGREFVKDIIRNKTKHKFNNPTITYYERDVKTEDKEEKTSTLYNYIVSSINENLIKVPSFTCYFPPSVKKSLLAEFLIDGVKFRNAYKKKAIAADAVGDTEGFKKYNPQQLAAKKRNNGISGLLTSRSTPLYNYSAHYTLTSMTRGTASTGNGISEKMIAGNKNYQHINIVYADILTNIYNNKYKDKLIGIINKYKLYKPTAKEVLDDILESTRLYWVDTKEEDKLLRFLDRLTEDDRAVFTYAGNIYSVKKYNPELMRDILSSFINVYTDEKIDTSILNKIPPGVKNLLHHVCMDAIKGKGVNYDKMDKEILSTLATIAKHIINSFIKYGDILSTISASYVAPPNLAYIKSMIRKATVLSDTDSTCATYQEWVNFYFGKYEFSSKAVAVAAVIMTFTTEAMGHFLNCYTSAMGIDSSMMGELDMKNEFTWLTMTPANVSKHYYADVIIKEGAVFPKSKLEKKGPHLIASTTARLVANTAENLMKHINKTVGSNELLSAKDIISEVIKVENEVVNEIKRGNKEFFGIGKINTEDSYKNPLPGNPYIRHIFWNSTFGKYYGMAPEPPYTTISVSTSITTKAKLNEWISGLSNKKLAKDLQDFILTYNRTSIPTIHINPYAIKELPEEIISIMEYRGLVMKLMNPLYIVLETLNIYRKPSLLLGEMVFNEHEKH